MSQPSAVSRRQLITVLVAFAVVNAAVWLWFIAAHSSRNLLRLEAFEPGDNAVLEGRPSLSWRFNLDVQHGDADAEPPVKVTPAVAGTWRWSDARTLQFNPSQDLPRATSIRFDLLPDHLRTRDNFRLPKTVSSVISTPALEVQEVQQAGMLEDNRFVLSFKFNDRVLPADVQSRLRLIGPDGKPLSFQLHGDAVGATVRVLTDSIARQAEGPTITVQLAKDLAGLSGPLGLREPYETKLQLEDGISCTSVSAHAPGRGDSYIVAQMNGPVDLEKIRQVVSVTPAVNFNFMPVGQGVELYGNFVCGTRYAVRFAEAPKGADARKYPRAGLFSVFMPDRSPQLWFEHEDGILGSKGNRTVLAHAVNTPQVQATVLRVYENNLVAWRNSTGRFRWQDQDAFSKPVATKRIKLSDVKNKPEDIRLSIDDLLTAGDAGDGVYRIVLRSIDPATAIAASEDDDAGDDSPIEYHAYHGSGGESAVVTLSDIGLVAKQHRTGVTVWAVSLSTAKPMPHVRVRLFSDKNQLLGQAISNDDGLATVEDVRPASGEKPRVILADRRPLTAEPAATSQPAVQQPARPELTWLDLNDHSWDLSDSEVGGRAYLRQGMEAFVYSDRGVYRPGETVQLRAILRNNYGAVSHSFPLRWRFLRPDGRPWRGETTLLDADGAAGVTLSLPGDLITGRWTAEVGIPDETGGVGKPLGSTQLLVEEYMPDRMKVGVHIAGDSGHGGMGDEPRGETRARADSKTIEANVQADYLFGQPAARLHGEVLGTLEQSVFAPTPWLGWSFGDTAEVVDSSRSVPIKPEWTRKPLEFETDGSGHGSVAFATADLLTTPRTTTQPTDLGIDRFMGPWHMTTVASVEEAGGRTVSSSDSAMVDVLPAYIGMRMASPTLRPNEPAEVSIAVVGTNGELVHGDQTLSAALFAEHWNTSMNFRNGRYQFDSTRVLEPIAEGVIATLHTSAGKGLLTINARNNGRYVLRVRDPQSGAMTSLAFYASDGSAWDDNVNRENPEHVDLVLLNQPASTQPGEQPTAKPRPFKAGERARVLVRSPFAGRLLLTIETDSVLQSRVIEMPASQVEVPIDVTPECWPNAYISATVVRDVQPDLKWRVHRAYGVRRLLLDSSDRKLAVKINHPAEMRPNGPLNVALHVTDPSGAPAADTAVTLAAVDEGILQLTDFRTPDPLHFFAAERALGVKSWDLYADLMPEVPRAGAESATGGDGDVDEDRRHQSGVSARRVRPVALFSGVMHTDGNGMASTTFDVPQHAGQLRLMAVAYNRACVGSSESKMLVRAPVIAQSSLPRFIAPGDRFNATMRVFNNSPAAGDASVDVELGENGLLAFGGGTESHRVFSAGNVAPGGAADVVVPLTAAQRTGAASIRLTTTLGNEHVEETTELAIRAASPQITRGGYATAEPGKPLDLTINNDMIPGTSSLQVRVTNWPSLQLPQGLDYLERYPYGCAEQTTSRCFPLVYLGDIGQEIAPGVFEKQRVAEKLQAGILRLMGMQTADGGLAMWPGESRSWPWVSVYAAHMLVEARRAGHAVPEDFEKRLLTYVRRQLDTVDDSGDALELQSYACYVLALTGKPDRSVMNRLTELATANGPAVQAEFAAQRGQARLYLSMAQAASGRSDLATALIPAPEALPQPRADRQHAGNIGSGIRDQAVLINAMLTAQADHPALPDLVQRLADSGRGGEWRSTHDCAFAVMALGHYLRSAPKHAPFASARLQIDGQTVAHDGELIWGGDMPTRGPIRVTVAGENNARGNVSWLQVGVPAKPPADADHGLRVRRIYCDQADKPLASSAVRSGELLRVDVTIEAPPGQANLVVEDLLPAGLEIENPRFETTAAKGVHLAAADEPAEFSPDRIEMHDDRMVIAGSMPNSWRARFSYLARAVTVGQYVLPPVRGECMYDIGINSVNGSGTFNVTPFETNVTAKTE